MFFLHMSDVIYKRTKLNDSVLKFVNSTGRSSMYNYLRRSPKILQRVDINVVISSKMKMKNITNYIVLVLLSIASILNAQSDNSITDQIGVTDIFGGILNDYQVTLMVIIFGQLAIQFLTMEFIKL